MSGAEILAGEQRGDHRERWGFVLGNVPPGRVELRVRRIGYAPAREVIDCLPALERNV